MENERKKNELDFTELIKLAFEQVFQTSEFISRHLDEIKSVFLPYVRKSVMI